MAKKGYKKVNPELYALLKVIKNIIVIDSYLQGYLIRFKDFPLMIPKECKSEIFDKWDSDSPYLITFS